MIFCHCSCNRLKIALKWLGTNKRKIIRFFLFLGPQALCSSLFPSSTSNKKSPNYFRNNKWFEKWRIFKNATLVFSAIFCNKLQAIAFKFGKVVYDLCDDTKEEVVKPVRLNYVPLEERLLCVFFATKNTAPAGKKSLCVGKVIVC